MPKEEKKAVMITFSIKTGKFESHYERNKFFRDLYGWKQIINTEKKVYTYHRGGLLDQIPHKRVDQSSFIIEEEQIDKIMRFFKGWHDKVIWQTFKVILDDEEFFEDWEKVEEE